MRYFATKLACMSFLVELNRIENKLVYVCFSSFQINKLPKAVAAANTFFLTNPDHMEMRQNLDYYRMMAGVQEDDFKDLEARPHMVKANSIFDANAVMFL